MLTITATVSITVAKIQIRRSERKLLPGIELVTVIQFFCFNFLNYCNFFVECAQSTREVRKLSFAWIAYDVIAKVKETNVLNNERMQIGGANPMYTFLEEHRKQYLIDHDADFKNFCELDHLITGEKSKEAISILKIYLEMIPGLDSVFFMLMRWGESLRLFDGKPIKIYHFFLMFILFATRQLASADGNAEPFFKIIEKEEYEKQKRDSSRGNIDPLTEKKRSDMVRNKGVIEHRRFFDFFEKV